MSCSFSLSPTPPYCCIQHVFIRFKCVETLFPQKNGSDALQCCSAANNFRSLYNVRAYRANINIEVAYIVLYYVHQWWLCGTNVLLRKKIIFSSEVKWMTLFDPLNGP